MSATEDLLLWVIGIVLACPATLTLIVSIFLRNRRVESKLSTTDVGFMLQLCALVVAGVGAFVVIEMIEACGACFMFWMPVALVILSVSWGLSFAGFGMVVANRRGGVAGNNSRSSVSIPEHDNPQAPNGGNVTPIRPAKRATRPWLRNLVIGAALLALLSTAWVIRMNDGRAVSTGGLITLKLDEEFVLDPRAAALALAAARGQTREVEALVRAGADVNATGDFYRVSPLMWAVMADSTEGIQALLKAGANPNLRVPEMTEDFAKAIYQRLTSKVSVDDAWRYYESNLRAFNRESALSFSIMRKSLPHLRLLLEAGGDPNLGGRTEPVMFDCLQTEDKPSPFLKLLIEHGGDPNLRRGVGEGGGTSLLDWYLFVGNTHNVIYLMEQGADPTRTVRDWLPTTTYVMDESPDEFSGYDWNEAAGLVQRYTGADGTEGSDSIRQVRAMMVERGVKFPVYEVACLGRIPEAEFKQLSGYQKQRRCHMSDALVQKIIDYNHSKGRHDQIRQFAEEYAADLAARKK
jgi:ankyrin repeat protein